MMLEKTAKPVTMTPRFRPAMKKSALDRVRRSAHSPTTTQIPM
jgi:hypothetical protein